MNMFQIFQRARRLALAGVVSAAAVVGPASNASAQSQDPQQQGSSDGTRMDPRKMIDQRLAKMTEALKLDSAQQTSIRWILGDETMEMEALRNSSGGARAGGAGGGGMGGRRGGGMGGGRRGGGGDQAPDSIDSARQSPKVQAIRDRANKKIEAVLKPDQLKAFQQLFEQPQKEKQ